VTAKQSAVKRCVVKLSDEERERLDALTHTGKHPARLLTKARILLKADASEAGEGWSDSRIAEALDTSTDTVARTRQQLGVTARFVQNCTLPGPCSSPLPLSAILKEGYEREIPRICRPRPPPCAKTA
jgi:Homeodomain-like domain